MDLETNGKQKEEIQETTQEITNEKWEYLVEQIKATITEAVHNSRWMLVEGYWNVGKLIREELPQKGITKALQALGVDVGVSDTTLWYALQFYDKYPDLNTVPEGKNISWNKIITKYLPGREEDKYEYEYWIKCPKCGHKFTMEKYQKTKKGG